MDVSIITVTYQSEKFIGEQLKSAAEACGSFSCEQIVADNASSDGTAAIISKDFPRVRLIKNSKNLGFAAANNIAAHGATGEFLLFLNPDVKANPGSIAHMITWMRAHPRVGIASCKLVNPDGSVNRNALPRRFPTVFDQLTIMLKLHHFFPWLLNRYMMSDIDPDKEQVVDSVRGSFMMMRREFVDALGFAFDPRYFIWFEDVDICREARRQGFTVMHVPSATCVDYVGQSFKNRDSLWKQKMFTKSMLTYFQKWEPWSTWMWIVAFRPVAIGMIRVRDIFV